jgi:hypothetical protein
MFDMGRRHLSSILVCACLLGVGTPTAAQAPRAPAAQEAPPPPTDPLGRESHSGRSPGSAPRFIETIWRSPRAICRENDEARNSSKASRRI